MEIDVERKLKAGWKRSKALPTIDFGEWSYTPSQHLAVCDDVTNCTITVMSVFFFFFFVCIFILLCNLLGISDRGKERMDVAQCCGFDRSTARKFYCVGIATLILTHKVCPCNVPDVRSSASSRIFSFSGTMVWVLPLSICLFLRRDYWSFFARWKCSFVIFFFHFCLFDDVHFQYSQELTRFLFSKCSHTFLIGQLNSLCYLSFPTSHWEHGTFFLCQNPLLYPGYIFLFLSPIIFHFLQFDAVHEIEVIKVFWSFCKFVAFSAFSNYIIERHHCYFK